MTQQIEFQLNLCRQIIDTTNGPKKISTLIVICKKCSQILGAAETIEDSLTLANTHFEESHPRTIAPRNGHATRNPEL